MSWFGNNPVVAELEEKIEEATSEAIPNGELDLSLSLEITDLIRSKKIEPKQSMRLLKKRLTANKNPNIQLSSLRLIDTCIKNCGFHFLIEISSREFIDSVVLLLNNSSTNNLVKDLILELIQEWSIAFEGQLQLNYVEKKYEEMKKEGFQFPRVRTQISSKFVDSEVPPDWVDSDACMICSNPFSMINRKHHCRSCGGVYCQDHSSKTTPLIHLGIVEPVRVCDTCYDKAKSKKSHHKRDVSKSSFEAVTSSSSNVPVDDEDDELKRAIELSLKESQGISHVVPMTNNTIRSDTIDNHEEEDDDEMKAAIEASLRDFEGNNPGKANGNQQPSEETYNPYGNILPAQATGTYPIADSSNQAAPPVANNELTLAEEESVNLFVNLMERMKTAPPSTILEDENLQTLHDQVAKLHPRLNKSMRESIKKYETFLELNQKISTIARLYDQLLEARLSRAYNYNSPAVGYGYPSYANEAPPQQNYYNYQQTQQQYPSQPEPSQNYPPQQQHYQIPPQHTQPLTERYPGESYVPEQYQQSQLPSQPEYYGAGTEQEPSEPPAGIYEQQIQSPAAQMQQLQESEPVYSLPTENPQESALPTSQPSEANTAYSQHPPTSPVVNKTNHYPQQVASHGNEYHSQATRTQGSGNVGYQLPSMPNLPQLPSFNNEMPEQKKEEVQLIEL